MRHDPHLGETKSVHERSKILSVHISSPIRQTIRTCLIWITIAAAVSDGVIAACKFWKMLQPHSIVLQTAVNKYNRLALAQLDIRKHGAVSRNSSHFVGRGHGVYSPENNRN